MIRQIDISQLTLEQLKELADSQVAKLAKHDLTQPPFSEVSEFEHWATLLGTFLEKPPKSGNGQVCALLASALLLLMRLSQHGVEVTNVASDGGGE